MAGLNFRKFIVLSLSGFYHDGIKLFYWYTVRDWLTGEDGYYTTIDMLSYDRFYQLCSSSVYCRLPNHVVRLNDESVNWVRDGF